MLRGQQLRVGIERALGQLSREPDKSRVGEQLCKTQRGLAALSPTQNIAGTTSLQILFGDAESIVSLLQNTKALAGFVIVFFHKEHTI